MRRLLYLVSLITAGTLMCSCDWGIQVYQPTNPTIFVVNNNTERLEVGPEAQEQVVYISSDMFWYATLQDGSWCTLGEQSYYNEFTSSLSFRVVANPSMESRTDSLIVLSGQETRKIAIVQNGLGSLLNVSEINLHGTIPVQYKFNAKGRWSVEKSGDWFTVSPESNTTGTTVTFTAVSENLDTDGRTGSVTFKMDGLNFTVPVKQSITETIIVESKTWSLESMGGSFSIKTLTNVDYMVSTDASWIHELGTRDLLEFDEPFSADENLSAQSRVGHITFTYHDISEVVTVTQAGRDPILDNTTPGFYGIQGQDYIYRKGICQNSRFSNGTDRSYRLIIPSEVCVVQLQGVPYQISTGATLSLALSVHKNGRTVYSQPVSAKIIAQDENLIWLRSTNSMYYILKKQ
ncbi:MAG: BACON domain-containing protein [Bacteroidales bacterium]|nr:BACON domain-containing protein [Bacteroidales bacterium]